MQFDARLGDYKNSMICQPLYKRLTPYARWSTLISAIVFVGAYACAIIMNRMYETKEFNWIGLIGIAALFLGYIAIRLRIRKHWKSVDSAPYRQGITKVSINETGIRFENALSSLFYRWEGVVDVVEGRGATLVLVGGMEAIAIPDHTLPDGLSAKAFQDTMRGYLPES